MSCFRDWLLFVNNTFMLFLHWKLTSFLLFTDFLSNRFIGAFPHFFSGHLLIIFFTTYHRFIYLLFRLPSLILPICCQLLGKLCHPQLPQKQLSWQFYLDSVRLFLEDHGQAWPIRASHHPGDDFQILFSCEATYFVYFIFKMFPLVVSNFK
jgi:hypothetical protein